MPETTVKSFAEQIGVAPDKLLQQLVAAGIADKKSSDPLSDDEKMALLNFLRTHHGAGEPEAKRITLTQKSTSKIMQNSRFGQSRAVQVEVRKKRTFVKRPVPDEPEAPPAEAEAIVEPVAERVAEPEAPPTTVTPPSLWRPRSRSRRCPCPSPFRRRS
nr:translation initiation factor IF-2 associated domain-containing protein [Acidiferrobacter thiooxydans]